MTDKRQDLTVLSVYGYSDYRTYLTDFYHMRKNGTRGYSFRAFSKKAGFSSPNILKLVMEGDRNIGPDSVEKFIKALGLDAKMAAYFRCLVRMNQATSTDEKTAEFEVLKQLTPLSKRRELGSTTMQYLSNWLYPVLREMVLMDSFKYDPYWVDRRLVCNVGAKEINMALTFLTDHGFIAKGPEGRYHATDHAVASTDEVRSLAIRRYHKIMLEQSIQILDKLPMELREFGALTFNLPQEALGELKQRLKEFRQELHHWALKTAEGCKDGSVIQVNIQMYPQTREIKES